MAKSKAEGTQSSRRARPPSGRVAGTRRPKLKNKVYLAELDRLQLELSKLQEWVKARGLKVVVIFEGRDAAGKGGVDQDDHAGPQPAHRPRRRAARPDRARADAVVLPALRGAPAGRRRDRAPRPQLVQPRRRRARDGLRDAGGGRGVLPLLPGVRADARALRDHPRQVLVLRQRRGAGAPVPGPHRRPDQALEALADGPRCPGRAGSSTRWPRTRCSGTRTSSRRRGTWSAATTRGGPGST